MITACLLCLVCFLCTRGPARLSAQNADSLRFEHYAAEIGDNFRRDTVHARVYFDSLQGLTERLPGNYYRGVTNYYAAQLQDRYGNASAARKLADLAFAQLRKVDKPGWRAESAFLPGILRVRTGELDSSFHYLLIALEEFRLAGDRKGAGAALNSMGNTHRRAGNFEEAIGYLEEAAVVFAELGQLRNESTAVLNLAIVYKLRKEYAEALKLYARSLKLSLAETPPDEIGTAYTYNNISGVYREMKEPERALENSRNAYEIFQRLGGPREQAASLLGVATNELDLERYAAAETHLRQVLVIGKDYDNFLMGAMSGLQKIFTERRDIDSTLHYVQLANVLRDSINERKRLSILSDMEGKYQNAEKQREIDRLEFAEELKAARLRRQSWVIGLGALALAILGLLIYRIVGQRRVIEKSLREKETLLHEIHHRVKNNLQMVSSLLSLQSRYVTDGAALDALKMGNSRVRSMAIIHQKLYLSDEVSTRIRVKDYLEKLLNELVATLQLPGLELETTTDLEDIELDIDTVIPLGLIANELVTNSLKYAYENRQTGKLALSLQRTGDAIEFTLQDDGAGFDPKHSKNPESFGYLLINTLTEQLEGTLRVVGGAGTRVRLSFPNNSTPI